MKALHSRARKLNSRVIAMTDVWRLECPECSSRQVRASASQPGWYCSGCETTLSEVTDLKAGETLEAEEQTDSIPPGSMNMIPHPHRRLDS